MKTKKLHVMQVEGIFIMAVNFFILTLFSILYAIQYFLVLSFYLSSHTLTAKNSKKQRERDKDVRKIECIKTMGYNKCTKKAIRENM